MRSSYLANGLGHLLTHEVVVRDPKVLVELGVLDGYSTLCIAEGLQSIDSKSKLDSYDLFEDYKFKHGDMKSVKEMLARHDLGDYVNLIHGDAYKVHANYPNYCIDFLHIDISNTGKIVHDMMELWHPKMSEFGCIIFEGGSQERDEIEWMKKYDKPSIRHELEHNKIIKECYSYHTFDTFPSLTILTPTIVGNGYGA